MRHVSTSRVPARSLRYDQVYDYVDGIADWKAAGLPTQGTADPGQRVIDATRRDVPTCQPTTRLATSVADQLKPGGRCVRSPTVVGWPSAASEAPDSMPTLIVSP